jgi:protein involved in polysaccharide export with SLBB domain
VAVEAVDVQVGQYDSQRVYLFGEVSGEQRAVAYQGPEKVTDLLRRAGGITPDSAPDAVRVVRQGLLPGAEHQVFQVNLHAILLQGDEQTNIQVMPYDQIYVPESRACRIGKCLHPLLRPVGRWLSGDS